jgi:hypothetical protein
VGECFDAPLAAEELVDDGEPRHVVRCIVEEDVGLGIAWVRERSAGTPRLLHERVRIAKRRGHRPGVTR